MTFARKVRDSPFHLRGFDFAGAYLKPNISSLCEINVTKSNGLPFEVLCELNGRMRNLVYKRSISENAFELYDHGASVSCVHYGPEIGLKDGETIKVIGMARRTIPPQKGIQFQIFRIFTVQEVGNGDQKLIDVIESNFNQ
ncbi:hypothetical protein MP228_012687 [Amoeboaphelidium protococcarum]|nr:hypothetical protein MP228_012687 [Amoeboaphelidium protococcarum]